MKKICLFIVLFLFIISWANDEIEMDNQDSLKAITRNKYIGKGINLGNALEAPNEGEWGLYIEERFIDSIRLAGFNSVRIPICWSCHTRTEYPYDIDETFLARVDEVVEWCIERNLVVVITIHHFNELYEFPGEAVYREMFFSIWEQLTRHYERINRDKLIFEPLNEPHGNLTAREWNKLIPEILHVIRSVDTDRTLVIDVPDYGYHRSIRKLVIPGDERNVIVSVRYYQPYEFTHEGAHWAKGSGKWVGTTWSGSTRQKKTVIADMEFIKSWADKNNRPITVGEWGSIIYCDHASRLSWTRFVSGQIEKHGFSSSYFDFGVRFRAYDLENDRWLDEYVPALLGVK